VFPSKLSLSSTILEKRMLWSAIQCVLTPHVSTVWVGHSKVSCVLLSIARSGVQGPSCTDPNTQCRNQCLLRNGSKVHAGSWPWQARSRTKAGVRARVHQHARAHLRTRQSHPVERCMKPGTATTEKAAGFSDIAASCNKILIFISLSDKRVFLRRFGGKNHHLLF